jgi:hypothetical protein
VSSSVFSFTFFLSIFLYFVAVDTGCTIITQRNNTHVLWDKDEIRNGSAPMDPPPDRDARVKVILVARLLLTQVGDKDMQVRTQYIHEKLHH